MSLLPLGHLQTSSLQHEWNGVAFSIQENQLSDDEYLDQSVLGNRLARHIDGSLKMTPKTPAEIVGERVIRPLVDTAIDLSNRSFQVLKSGFSFLNHIFSKACNFLPVAEGSPISSGGTGPTVLTCSTPISSTFQGSGHWQAGMDSQGDIVAALVDGKRAVAISLPADEKTWSTPVELSPESDNMNRLSMDVNAEGDALAIWWNYEAQRSQQSTLSLGKTWTPFVNITNWAELTPSVNLHKNGDATAIWDTCCDSDSQVQVSTFSVGKGWTPTTTIGDSQPLMHQEPILRFDPIGNAVAAWLINTTTLQVATCPVGGQWTAPVTILSIDALSFQNPYPNFQLVVAGNGDALVVLANSIVVSGFNSTIKAATRPFGGNWSSPFIISSDAPDSLQAASDMYGNSIVVWNGVSISTRLSGGTWTAPFTLTNEYGSQNPAVTVDENKNAFVVWIYSEGRFSPTYSLKGSTCSLFSGTCTTPVTLVHIGLTFNWGPVIKMDSKGNAVIFWAGQDEDNCFAVTRCSLRYSKEELDKPAINLKTSLV